MVESTIGQCALSSDTLSKVCQVKILILAFFFYFYFFIWNELLLQLSDGDFIFFMTFLQNYFLKILFNGSVIKALTPPLLEPNGSQNIGRRKKKLEKKVIFSLEARP